MIIKPIIPIWLMSIICIIAIFIIIFNKPLKNILLKKQENKSTERQRKLIMQHILNVCIKICIIILLFIINLRFMIPNGEVSVLNPNINILFVIDKTVSMRALDYNNGKERLEGVKNDCCYIVDKLPNCKYSIITFGDLAQRIVPFTSDTSIIQSEIKAISVEDGSYAKGTSLNIVKNSLEETLKNEKEKRGENVKFLVFFISDGEITMKNEKLESFSNIQKYVDDGAVMGYGTEEGGKMVWSLYEDNPASSSYYKHYYDENYNSHLAISKIDENNLKQLSSDLKIDYIQMSKTSNIDNKIKSIKKQIENSGVSEDTESFYQDIYYYFAIPLVILLLADFILQKRRL